MKEIRRPSSAISWVKESIPFVNAIRLQESFTARAERLHYWIALSHL